MDMRELSDQNPWWRDEKLIEEDYDIIKWKEKKLKWVQPIVGKIGLSPFALHIITGPRQVGKTTAMKLLVRELIKSVEPKSIFYFNCENLSDYRELLDVLNTYLEFKASNTIKNSIVMLDEITLPKEWYRAIKSLVDRGAFRNDVLILTGSASISVKREVELFPGRRGKGEDFIMYPLSFREFLKIVDPGLAKKIPAMNTIDEIDKKALNSILFEKELNRHLETYMKYGGFPLSIAHDIEDAKKTYLSWVKNAILKADRSDVIARQIIKVLIESLQSDVSWEGISKKIEIKSPKTVAAYIDLMKSVFIVNVLHNMDISEKKIRFGRNKKIHFRDPLLLEIFEEWCLVKKENKMAAIAESLVVDHLSRMFPERIFFWRDGTEIDVIVQENGKLYGFEVKWSEKTGLSKKPQQIKKLIIITKKDYSRNQSIPLSVFLSMLDV